MLLLLFIITLIISVFGLISVITEKKYITWWRFILYFAWYDLWIGLYIDRIHKVLYFCPLPCIVISFNFGKGIRSDDKLSTPTAGW